MIGRDGELSRLRGIVGAARRGVLRVAVVEAEAGLGATTLLDAVVGDLPSATTVVRGRADEFERARPLHPFAVEPGLPEHRGRAALLDTLEGGALREAAVLVVEDLQWADPSTLALLDDVVNRLGDLPVALLLAVRPSPPSPVVELCERLVTQVAAEWLVLEPLPPAAIEEVAAGVLGAPCGPRLAAVLGAAEGNVAAACEVLSALQVEERLVHRDSVVDVDDDALPGGVRQTIVRRLRTLPTATVAALQVASVLGETFARSDLALVLGRSDDDPLEDLEPAIEHGVLRTAVASPSQLAFRSALMRESLYLDLAAPLRGALHAEAALALDRAAGAPERVAAHLLRAGLDHGPELAELLLRTSRALRDTAPALSLAMAERGLSFAEDDVIRDALRAATVWPMVVAGRDGEAESIARELLHRARDPELETDLLLALAVGMQRRGQLAIGHDRLEVLLQREDLPESARPVIEARMPLARLAVGDLDGAAALGEKVLAAAEERGDSFAMAMALVPMALVAAARGEVARALELAEAAATFNDELPVSVDGVALALPAVLLEADRLDDARAAVQRVVQRDEETGDRSMTTVSHFVRTVVDGLAGAFDDAVTEAEAALSVVAREGGSSVANLFAFAFLSRIGLHRDDVPSALAWVAEGEAALEAGGPQHGVDFLLWAKALVVEATDGPAAALELLGLSWDLLVPARYLLSWRSVAPDLVRLALACDDRDRAEAVTEAAEEGAARAGGIASADGAALRCRALLDLDTSAALAAVERFRASPRIAATAECEESAASVLSACGRSAESTELLRSALATFDRLGATRDANRVLATLRADGAATPGRRARSGARTRPAGGWGSLTAKEQEVVALVAQGLTNPQIAERLYVSRYTVETHLKHVFAKLGLTSRVELAASAARNA